MTSIEVEQGVTLEGQYHRPADARATVVLSHPHPQYGGDMHNPLIQHLFMSLPEVGIATLRYNFRGVSASSGSHDGGVGERQDVAAALAAGAGLGASGPLVSVGWSFGADVSLGVNSDLHAAWVAIAAPLAIVDPAEMTAATDPRPTLLLVPEHDQFRTPDQAAHVTAEWAATTVTTIEGGDHFLMGRTHLVVGEVEGFISSL